MRIFSSKGFHPERLTLEETLFHTANGYLGVRANFEEGRPEGERSIRGCYINGFYDTHSVHHPEKLYGFPEISEKIVNVTDSQSMVLFADGERMLLTEQNVGDFERVLDMDAGTVRRSFVWTTKTGKRLRVAVRRLASFRRRELFAVDYAVTAMDGPVELRIESSLEGDVSNYFDASDPRVSGIPFKSLAVRAARTTPDGALYVESRTTGTGFILGVLSTHTAMGCVSGSGPAENATVRPITTASGPTAASVAYALAMDAGASFRLTRKTVFVDSIRHGENVSAVAERIAAMEAGFSFEDLIVQQAAFLSAFWEGADIAIEGDPAVEEGVRYNLYQLLQAASPDKFGNIAAKGLSGEGYEGHYFWDTEIYMAPFFIYSNPAMARNLLSFRHATLGAARERAAEMGQMAGAAYPWRTIAGRECSAYYPSGSAQYHINADIAYAYMSYYEASGDFNFMEECGAEVLFETARTWLDIGHFKDGRFRIEAVTGPDEYTCLVDNNYYTNAMARHNLVSAVRIYRELLDRSPERLRSLLSALTLGGEEVAEWERAASAMYLPYDEGRDLTPQDEGFLSKEVWDFAHTPEENYPLLLHYHHLAIIRKQVCKQADAVLAHLLLPDLVAESTKRNSFDYYERITTHDSSLSYSVFGAMAARLGDAEKAYKYLLKTVRLDLDDSHGNSKDGLHAAAMGGTWMAVIFGFGGFKAQGGTISIDPLLPAAWTSFSFKVRYLGRSISVRVGRETVRIDLLSGDAIELFVHDRPALLDSRGLLIGIDGDRLSP